MGGRQSLSLLLLKEPWLLIVSQISRITKGSREDGKVELRRIWRKRVFICRSSHHCLLIYIILRAPGDPSWPGIGREGNPVVPLELVVEIGRHWWTGGHAIDPLDCQ